MIFFLAFLMSRDREFELREDDVVAEIDETICIDTGEF
jgi:hypothetical protein